MKFEKWLKKQLIKDIPDNVIAFNFNLYETDDDESFDVQLVGCENYSKDDEDWACDTVFSSEEDVFTFKDEDWESALETCKSMIQDFLASCDSDNKLSRAEYVTVGFIDGDLEVIFSK